MKESRHHDADVDRPHASETRSSAPGNDAKTTGTEAPDRQNVWSRLSRNPWLISGVAALAMGGIGLLLDTVRAPVYAAEATVEFRRAELGPESARDGIETLESDAFLDRVLDFFAEDPRRDALATAAANLEFSEDPRGGLSVRTLAPEPDLARDLVNRVVREYAGLWSESLPQNEAPDSQETSRLDESLADLRSTESRLSEAREDLARTSELWQRVQQSTPEQLADESDSPSLEAARERLAELNETLSDLSLTYTPANYQVRQVQDEIREIEEAIRLEVAAIPDRAWSDYQDAVRTEASLEAEYERLRSEVAGLNARQDSVGGTTPPSADVGEASTERLGLAPWVSFGAGALGGFLLAVALVFVRTRWDRGESKDGKIETRQDSASEAARTGSGPASGAAENQNQGGNTDSRGGSQETKAGPRSDPAAVAATPQPSRIQTPQALAGESTESSGGSADESAHQPVESTSGHSAGNDDAFEPESRATIQPEPSEAEPSEGPAPDSGSSEAEGEPEPGAELPEPAPSESARIELASHADWNSPMAKSVRSLATTLLSEPARGAGRVATISSPHSGEGKTTIACNLGIVLAAAGKRVLLVDGHLTAPRLAGIFEVEPTMGLGGILAGPLEMEDISIESEILRTQFPGLYVLPTHRVAPFSGGTDTPLVSERVLLRLNALVSRLRSHFDISLFDTPALSERADARILARQTDGVVLVFGNGDSANDSSRAEWSRLKADGTRLLGTIHNRWEREPDQTSETRRA